MADSRERAVPSGGRVGSRPSTPLIFVHIPKTGGTSVSWATFTTAFPPEECRILSGRPGENELAVEQTAQLPESERRGLRVIAGHNTFELRHSFPDSPLLTVLRAPQEQLASMYLHALRSQREGGGESRSSSPEPGSEPSFDVFLRREWCSPIHRLGFSPQFSAIAEDGESAEQVLDRLDLFGLTCSLVEFLVLLRLRYGIPLVLFHDRLVAQESRSWVSTSKQLELIRQLHADDIDLWDRARERYREQREMLMGPAETELLARYEAALARFRERWSAHADRTALFDEIGERSRLVAVAGRPRVSIVTTCFNGVPYIADCIESVLGQDYPHLEHIIQDGGSGDGTVDVLRRYGDRIDWVSEPDDGEADGLDRALGRATGDVLLVLNADDMLVPGAVRWGVDQLAKYPHVAVVYGDQYVINSLGEIIGALEGPDPWSYAGVLCVEKVPPAQAAFLRRSHFHQVGLRADTTLATCPDHEMWVRIGRLHPSLHVSELVTKYRWHSEGTGRQREGIEQMVRDKWTVNLRVFDDPQAPAELRALRRRARSSLDLWAASMYVDVGETRAACSSTVRALMATPSRQNWERVGSGIRYLLRWKAQGRRWDGI